MIHIITLPQWNKVMRIAVMSGLWGCTGIVDSGNKRWIFFFPVGWVCRELLGNLRWRKQRYNVIGVELFAVWFFCPARGLFNVFLSLFLSISLSIFRPSFILPPRLVSSTFPVCPEPPRDRWKPRPSHLGHNLSLLGLNFSLSRIFPP